MLKMIIVDDERISREGLLNYIDWKQDYGVNIVGTAANGKEGYELYLSVRPDLVLTDIKMPHMNGIELAESIRARDQSTKIILLSAYGEFTYAQQALQTGVDDYLLKPVEEHDLRRMMDRIVIQKRDQDQRETSHQTLKALLEREADICSRWNGHSFQAFILGKEPCQDIGVGSGFWLVDFRDGATVAIAKYEPGEPESRERCSAVGGFEYCYSGRRVDSPEEVGRSYNEAVLAQNIGTYWELKELDYTQIEKRREQWIRYEADIQHELVKLAGDIRTAVGDINHLALEAVVHRTVGYLSRNSGVDPSYIEDFIMRLSAKATEGFPLSGGIKDLLLALKTALQGQHIFGQMKEMLCSWLLDLLGLAEDQRRLSEITMIERVLQIIEREYQEEIGLRTIAERVYLSPNYLGNVFRNATGMYFNDYLADYRMNKAKELLLSGSEKVTRIGEAVGIPNHSYFSSLFKKTYGYTPKEYRRIFKALEKE